jgi:hypothetical protein
LPSLNRQMGVGIGLPPCQAGPGSVREHLHGMGSWMQQTDEGERRPHLLTRTGSPAATLSPGSARQTPRQGSWRLATTTAPTLRGTFLRSTGRNSDARVAVAKPGATQEPTKPSPGHPMRQPSSAPDAARSPRSRGPARLTLSRTAGAGLQ